MGCKLIINEIPVGKIKITGGKFPALNGILKPNEHFEQFRKVYEKYYSNNSTVSQQGEDETLARNTQIKLL